MKKITKYMLSCISILFILCFSCAEDDQIIVEPIEEEEEEEIIPQNFSFLALGDSYTIGQGVAQEESWPFQLKDALQSQTRKIEPVTVIAQTGWTTTNLLNAIEEENPANHDMVSLLIGVNNQFQSKPFELFTTEFNLLLDKAIELAGGTDQVIVVSIPDYGVTPFGSGNSETIAQELDEYNMYIKAQCFNNQVAFVDVTQISRELGDSANALASDNLHPSAFQYSKWVEQILPVADEILR